MTGWSFGLEMAGGSCRIYFSPAADRILAGGYLLDSGNHNILWRARFIIATNVSLVALT
jgi:hypothetical protein